MDDPSKSDSESVSSISDFTFSGSGTTFTSTTKTTLKLSATPTTSKSGGQKRKATDSDEGGDRKPVSTPKRLKKPPESDQSSSKSIPLSERQQMAMALAMSVQQSGGSSPQQMSGPTHTSTTPRSAKADKRNAKGESGLHLAAKKGDLVQMKSLIKCGVDVNVQDFAGWTPLHEAVIHGFVTAAHLLLRKGANVNAQGLDNDTPLHDASINGQPELVGLLLKYGADPHQPNSMGRTPLDLANNLEIESLLKGKSMFKPADDGDSVSSSDSLMMHLASSAPEYYPKLRSPPGHLSGDEGILSKALLKETARSPLSPSRSPRRLSPPASNPELIPVDRGLGSIDRCLSSVDHDPSSNPHHPGSMSHHPSSLPHHPGSVDSGPGFLPHHTSSMLHHTGSADRGPGPMVHRPGSIPHQPGSVPHHPGSVPHHPGSVDRGSGFLPHHLSSVDFGLNSVSPAPSDHGSTCSTGFVQGQTTDLPTDLPAFEDALSRPSKHSADSLTSSAALPVTRSDANKSDQPEPVESTRSESTRSVRQSLNFAPLPVKQEVAPEPPKPQGGNSELTVAVSEPLTSELVQAMEREELEVQADNRSAAQEMIDKIQQTLEKREPTTLDEQGLSKDEPTTSIAVATNTASDHERTPGVRPSNTSISNPAVSDSKVSTAPEPSIPPVIAAPVSAPGVSTPKPSTPRVSTPKPSAPRVSTPKPSAPRVYSLDEAPSVAETQAPSAILPHPEHVPANLSTEVVNRVEADKIVTKRDTKPDADPVVKAGSASLDARISETVKSSSAPDAIPMILLSTISEASVKADESKLEPTREPRSRLGALKGESKSRPVSPAFSDKPSRPRASSMNQRKRRTRDKGDKSETSKSEASPDQQINPPDFENSIDSVDSANQTSGRTTRTRTKLREERNEEAEPLEAPMTRETRRKARDKSEAGSRSPAPSSKSALRNNRSADLRNDDDDATMDTNSTVSATPLSSAPTPTTSNYSNKRLTRSHTKTQSNAANQPPPEKLEEPIEPPKKKKAKAAKQEVAPPPSSLPPVSVPTDPSSIPNPIHLFRDLRKEMRKRWEQSVNVCPKAPKSYSNFLINTKQYLIASNASSNASKMAIPTLVAPVSLPPTMKEFFNKQEQERYKLRQQQLIERDKLKILHEQEVLRVLRRGIMASSNQQPISVCSVIKDMEAATVYHPYNALKDGADEKLERGSTRSHFNNRQLLSWKQDIEDKFENLKDQLIGRHHNEAEALSAVQRMDWEWKLKECGACEYTATPNIDELHVPMVQVINDLDMLFPA